MGSMHFFTAMPQATGQVSRSYFHKLLNFNDVTDIYRRQNRSRGDKLRRSLSRCWTNPAASKSQMKIKLSHQSVHKEGTTTIPMNWAILDADRAADLELLSNANSVS